MARAVLATLAAQLGGRQPNRLQLWLMRRPRGVHAGVWDAVCLAALAATDGGRRQLSARTLHAHEVASLPSSSRRPPPPPPPPAQLVLAAQRHAVARFWDLLQDLCSVGTLPAAPGWLAYTRLSNNTMTGPRVAYTTGGKRIWHLMELLQADALPCCCWRAGCCTAVLPPVTRPEVLLLLRSAPVCCCVPPAGD